MSEDAIQALVSSAQQGDRDAFGQIYVEFQGRVRGFFARRISDREAAEDLAQQAFVKSWQGLPQYRRSAAPFAAWLFRIARNVLIDHYRRHRESVDIDGVDVSDDSNHDELLMFQERYEAVERALQSLREDYQQVIRLRFLMEHSTAEVAAIMERSEGAIRVLQLRAIRALRIELNLDEFEERAA